MGNPVVHFEVIGKDGEALQSFYSELFGWKIDANNDMKYGTIAREDNLAPDGTGIGGGVATGPDGYEGHVTFYVYSPDIEASLDKAVELGGEKIFGPDEVMPGMLLGQFKDPEGHVIGLVNMDNASPE
jgi:predicted enzyme related to lactoylglutathione lyase